MISKEEVWHIAKLARLGLTEKEVEKYQKELSSILAYFEKLKEVDIKGVESTPHSVKVENIMREDKSTKPKSQKPIQAKRDEVGDEAKLQRASKLMELAPETKEGYLKVKSIF